MCMSQHIRVSECLIHICMSGIIHVSLCVDEILHLRRLKLKSHKVA